MIQGVIWEPDEGEIKNILTNNDIAHVFIKKAQAMLASQYEVTSTQSAKVMGSQLMGSWPETQTAIDNLLNAHGLTTGHRPITGLFSPRMHTLPERQGQGNKGKIEKQIRMTGNCPYYALAQIKL